MLTVPREQSRSPLTAHRSPLTARRVDMISGAGVGYRYELRRDDEVIATGHLSREQPLEVGDRIDLGGQHASVRTTEPLLGEPELRLVVRLLREGS
jgi:hypothetical protein